MPTGSAAPDRKRAAGREIVKVSGHTVQARHARNHDTTGSEATVDEPLVQHMADHWWWRPGWAMGRRYYTWHLTFADQFDVHRVAESYRLALAPLDVLDPVPNKWLHLTMQGVGFVHEVSRSTVDEIVAAAAGHLAGVEPFDLRFGRPEVEREGVCWAFDTPGAAAVRDAVRAGIGEVLPDVPGPADGFRPHVSIAYSNGEGPAAPIREALVSAAPEPADARIGTAELIILNRDNRLYEWETYASVPLGSRT